MSERTTADGPKPVEVAGNDAAIEVSKLDLSNKPYDTNSDTNSDSGSDDAALTPEQKEIKAQKAQDKKRRAIIAALPPAEGAVLLSQMDTKEVTVSFFQLFKYATPRDKLIVAICAIAAIGAGLAMPLMAVVFGDLTGDLGNISSGNAGPNFQHTLNHKVLYFIYIAIGSFATNYIAITGFLYTGEHITCQIRQRYLRALLRQNIGFYDNIGAGKITTLITTQTSIVQDGISDKLALCLTAIATFVAALVVAFTKSWKLSLILLSVVVAIVLVMGVGGFLSNGYMNENQKMYAQAGDMAEEVISSIRTATAFNIQNKLALMYDAHLKAAEKSGFRHQSAWGYIIAGMFMIIYLSYALGFWEGSRLLVRGEITIGELLTVLMSIIFGAFSLGNGASNFKNIGQAMEAAIQIYSTIERNSPIDSLADNGLRPEHLDGNVELRNIRHIYPSRPQVVVMDDINLSIPAGKITALVGPSGSGKSTIIGLIERFYNPVGGQVLIDGQDITKLNMRWLRQHVALVSQEPVLFSVSIYENIRFGLPEEKCVGLTEEQIKQLVVNAAKEANAHDFISNLPKGYDTLAGERGMLLSGGQKQRVAIARAIISDPKILLLDEATSALDTKSEGIVQAALDRASNNRTTIVIAHRLSTIKNADNIVVMAAGKIVEQGRHDELLALGGMYSDLVQGQKISDATTLEEEEQDPGSSVESFPQTDDNEILVKPSEKGFAEDPAADQLSRQQTTKSRASVAYEKDAEKGDTTDKYTFMHLFRATLRFNKPETHILIMGVLAAVIAGAGQPVQSIFYAKSVTTLTLPPSQYAKVRHDINFWSGMFFMLAIVVFLAYMANGVLFAWCSEKLVHRVRDHAFRSMLRQEMAFFDDSANTTGSLTSFLSTKAKAISGMSGASLGSITMASATLIIGIVLSISLAWKIGLVMASTIPVLLGCGFLRFYLLARFERTCVEAYKDSAAYACETAASIRTVASLTREESVWKFYNDSLEDQMVRSLKSNLVASSLYAASQSANFLVFALGFWWGGSLLIKGEVTFFHFFVSYTSIVFGAQSAGNILGFVPDMGRARNAVVDMCDLMEREPAMDWWSDKGVRLASNDEVEGVIEFQDVHFRYPSRPKQPILRGLSFKANPGEYVALVGASGCGKSTAIQLIERFYDPVAGKVMLDGRDIREYNLTDYRSALALVGQEPALYQGTILENIKLGAGSDKEVTMEEVVQACIEANIHDFILSLPEGFATMCGPKATLLSGGQKQRIAIARALVRNPKVLLLDEATSALDSTSEQVVQAALDRAAKGRTTVVIAHRLSTIQNAHRILVVDGGKVVEEGSHQELLALKGRYADLVSLQGLGETGGH